MKRIVVVLTFVAIATIIVFGQLKGERKEGSSGFKFSKVVHVELKPTSEQEKVLQQARLEQRDDLMINLTPEQTKIFKRVFGIEAARSKVVPMHVPKPGFKVSQSDEEYYEIRDFYYVEADKGKEVPLTTYVDAFLVNVSHGRSSLSNESLDEGLRVELPWNTVQENAIRNAWAAKKEEVTVELTDAQLESLGMVSGGKSAGKSRKIKLMYGDLNLFVASANGECRYYTDWVITCKGTKDNCTMLCKPVCDCK